MRKWWLLSAAFVLWLISGYGIVQSRQRDASPAGSDGREPVRIVSMAPNVTEILFALGLGENVVAVTQDSDYPPAALEKSQVGTFWQPNMEAVVANQPDLVVTLAFEQQRDLARRLRRMGLRCLVVDIQSVGDLYDAIAAIGDAAGARVQAGALCDNIQSEIHKLQQATAGMPRVKVLWVVQREPLRVAGRDTFINEIIELASGENAIGRTLHKYPPIGAEQIIVSAPEVIIEPTMVQGQAERQQQAPAYWSRFGDLPALANERIYVIDGDMVSRLGPRLHIAVEAVAKCLRPELFGE